MKRQEPTHESHVFFIHLNHFILKLKIKYRCSYLFLLHNAIIFLLWCCRRYATQVMATLKVNFTECVLYFERGGKPCPGSGGDGRRGLKIAGLCSLRAEFPWQPHSHWAAQEKRVMSN